ncbi:MAG: thiol:disulfide interchange protein DsbA/DsbL [Gammaproteobacteria bacterium]|nr:thiol:disulfide interchange protein DsbA/DsbL [Gammaproteobacteria bacterium]MYF02642.1 thiol:disulfide interchange protein DsbA/DsbL [Gammaproteobacteria bacterium]MYI76771.1 thiol:disulfide interchange protein DsbA/DsbL [Gammaproteobacteria bacterium]
MKSSSIKSVFVLSALVLLNEGIVSSAEFEEGKHYKLIKNENESQVDEQAQTAEDVTDEAAESNTVDGESSSNEISVVEYFSYGCTHCYRLEPFIDTWLETKGEDVEFSRVAVPTREDWIPYARAYYIAEDLGILEKVHALMFRAIYVNKQPMGQKRLLKRMFTGVAEVEPEKFEEVWASDRIPKKVQNAVIEMRDLGVSASPTIVVAKKYLITPETAGDLAFMFDVVDFLVEKIKADREMEESTAANEISQ